MTQTQFQEFTLQVTLRKRRREPSENQSSELLSAGDRGLAPRIKLHVLIQSLTCSSTASLLGSQVAKDVSPLLVDDNNREDLTHIGSFSVKHPDSY